MSNHDVSFNSENNTLFVKEKDTTFVVDLNSGTFKRITKNKTADFVEDEPVKGMLNCKKTMEELNGRLKKVVSEVEDIKFKANFLDQKVKEALKDPRVK